MSARYTYSASVTVYAENQEEADALAQEVCELVESPDVRIGEIAAPHLTVEDKEPEVEEDE